METFSVQCVNKICISSINQTFILQVIKVQNLFDKILTKISSKDLHFMIDWCIIRCDWLINIPEKRRICMNNSFCMSAAYFLKTSDKDLGGETVASVVITGIAVVFVALILLIALVWCYGKIFDAINERIAAKEAAEAAAKAAEAAKSAPKVEAAAAPAVEDGIEEEIVAVISAAIAAYGAQTGKKLAIRSIRASGGAPSGRNAWSAAGLAEATRPF